MTDRDRLIELVDKAKEEYANDVTDHTETDYIVESLLNEGVIVPPCKVGDTIYIIDLFDYNPCKKSGKDGDVCPYLHAEYGVGYECCKTFCGVKPFSCAEIKTEVIEDITQIFCYWTCFGETVFLTKEEAERELEKRCNNA